jgi:small-conductance mechanosensitive channel
MRANCAPSNFQEAGTVVRILLMLVSLTAGLVAPAHATEPAAILLAQAGPGAPAERAATLSLHSRTIFEFRAPFSGYSPQERAEAAAHRLDVVLGKHQAGEVSVESIPEGNRVLVDGARVFVITPGDVNTLVDQTLDSLTRDAVNALSLAVAEVTEQRDLRTVLKALGYILIATLLYGVLVRLLNRYTARLREYLAERLGEKVEKLRIAGIQVVHPARFRTGVEITVTVAYWLLAMVVTYTWFTFALLQFPYTRAWGEHLETFLLSTLGDVIGAILSAIPGLLIVAIIVVLARFAVKLSRLFFDRVESGRVRVRWIDRDTARPTRRIATVVIWLFALAMVYPYLPGAQTDAFKGLSVLVGLMVSIGGASVVGQAASGLILMYSRSIRAGEYVRIGNSEGEVRELGMFATRLMTAGGEEIVLPSSYVLGQTTHNMSRMARGGTVVDTTVTIGYDTPWRQVHALLEEAARRTDDVLDEPAPLVMQTALSDFYVQYRLIARVDAGRSRPKTLSALLGNIQDVFNEHGVQIMSPNYVADPADPKRVAKEDWFAAPARAPQGEKKAG